MRLTSNRAGRSSVNAAPWLSPAWSIVAVTVALLLIFELDRVTDSTPVQHLYYLPIIFAGITFRMCGGLTTALAAVVLYHLANPHLLTFLYEQLDLVQIVLFIAVGVVTPKLMDDAQRLQALAMTDDLTGLHNLRSFEARLAGIMRASHEAGTPVCLLVLDVDRLKALNDKYGHLAGAEAVRTVGHIIAASLPATGIGCRYGGDEFVVALPSCARPQAARLADDLCRNVNAASPVLAGISFPSGTLSISVGLACHAADWSTGQSARDYDPGEMLFRAADAALYRAKETGRNHVFVA